MTRADLSIVIPTLDSAASLPAVFDSLAEGRARGLTREIVLVDGGSRDGTPELARARGARILDSPRGRGQQLRAGATACEGDWLFFLHADSRPQAGWSRIVEAFMAEPGNRARAAHGHLALDDADRRARRIERLAGWRSRRLGLPYGDQGLLIGRAHYERLGGFRPIPLMEDVDLVRRIGRRNLARLDCRVVTSAKHYRRDGWLARPARNLAILAGYYLGLPPRLLYRFYY